MNGGKRAIAIDEVPLERCFQSGVKLDFRQLQHGHDVTATEVETELARNGRVLSPLEIVLVNTAAGAALGTPALLVTVIGMEYDATMHRLERGIRVTCTDAWSWDAPFSYTARRIVETGDISLIWEWHKAGRDMGYCHIEELAKLDVLPPTGFTVSCFPHEVRGGSAGWTRAVAMFED